MADNSDGRSVRPSQWVRGPVTATDPKKRPAHRKRRPAAPRHSRAYFASNDFLLLLLGLLVIFLISNYLG